MQSFQPIQTSQMPVRDKLLNIIWHLINITIFRITPSYTGFFRKIRVWLLRLFGAKVSISASVKPSARIDFPWNLTMGDDSSLGEKSWAYCMAPIVIGSQSCIGKDVYLLTGSHDISSPQFNLVTKPIHIGTGVWVATDATILPGITLADMTVVAACAVVTKDTEPYDVIAGNPAKFIKKRNLQK